MKNEVLFQCTNCKKTVRMSYVDKLPCPFCKHEQIDKDGHIEFPVFEVHYIK